MNPDLVARLRADLAGADWTVDTVDQLLGPVAGAALAREQRVPALVRLRSVHTPPAQLTKAFILGERVDLTEALPTLGLAGAQELGLIDQDGSPLMDLRPHAAELPGGNYHWWIASDRCEMQTGRPLQPNHVLGIGPATLSLLRMTVREPVEVALDLGTGCGIQALYLATHAHRVVATEISARACAYTRFNAALNQVQLDVRQGSLFEPVAGEKFDLITSNPPFVITPPSLRTEGLLEYRDGGMDRDDLVAQVISTGPNLLRPGGVMQMLANWEVPHRGSWEDPIRTWLTRSGVGLDAWVVLRDRLDAAQYSELWLRDAGGNLQGRQRWEADYEQWIADFAQAGVDEVAMGFLALRRRSRDGVELAAELVEEGTFPDGKTVLAALDHVQLAPNWEDLAPVRAEDVREERHYQPGEADPQVIRLTQGAGMGRAIRVGSAMAALAGAADGELTAGQIVSAVAMLTDRERDQVAAEVALELPALLRAGMMAWAGSEQ
ncbi:methyltransferase [Scrofimicrobium sp. R131]|uniref:Methyltransferase n=1 Tax=Scrofimicrobium appendicitidis TaxID=3079930 RepID=A0AAU7V6K7_9ACTO